VDTVGYRHGAPGAILHRAVEVSENLRDAGTIVSGCFASLPVIVSPFGTPANRPPSISVRTNREPVPIIVMTDIVAVLSGAEAVAAQEFRGFTCPKPRWGRSSLERM